MPNSGIGLRQALGSGQAQAGVGKLLLGLRPQAAPRDTRVRQDGTCPGGCCQPAVGATRACQPHRRRYLPAPDSVALLPQRRRDGPCSRTSESRSEGSGCSQLTLHYRAAPLLQPGRPPGTYPQQQRSVWRNTDSRFLGLNEGTFDDSFLSVHRVPRGRRQAGSGMPWTGWQSLGGHRCVSFASNTAWRSGALPPAEKAAS